MKVKPFNNGLLVTTNDDYSVLVMQLKNYGIEDTKFINNMSICTSLLTYDQFSPEYLVLGFYFSEVFNNI